MPGPGAFGVPPPLTDLPAAKVTSPVYCAGRTAGAAVAGHRQSRPGPGVRVAPGPAGPYYETCFRVVSPRGHGGWKAQRLLVYGPKKL